MVVDDHARPHFGACPEVDACLRRKRGSGIRVAVRDLNRGPWGSAAQRLVDAAHLLATEPVSVQLRYLQTLTEIGVEKNTTVIFPVPVDFFSGLQKMLGKVGEEAPPAAKSA